MTTLTAHDLTATQALLIDTYWYFVSVHGRRPMLNELGERMGKGWDRARVQREMVELEQRGYARNNGSAARGCWSILKPVNWPTIDGDGAYI